VRAVRARTLRIGHHGCIPRLGDSQCHDRGLRQGDRSDQAVEVGAGSDVGEDIDDRQTVVHRPTLDERVEPCCVPEPRQRGPRPVNAQMPQPAVASARIVYQLGGLD